MRISGGAARGRPLEAPRGDATRPTADRTRESVFNILGNQLDLSRARVLDVFAGSGALGLEAISRGAPSAVLVDHDAAAVAVMRRNLTALGREAAGHPVRIVKDDAARAITRLAQTGDRFELCFLDPPYAAVAALAAALARLPAVLAPGAVVVVEYDRRSPPTWPPGLSPEDVREYGDTRVAFLRAPSIEGEVTS
ncbi:MAG: 16S rRNA (guanine(966)-N(2))-methyltransferase RsmD [Deltaproteobacteria bacterium]|nr:16S rRNA (guanine(966)-N(2))-methyltransferase RsmD [Deltaproteobacteria bacterium]